RTTFSPKRTTAAPWACLASFPVSIESCFPPAISTETFVASGFIDHPLYGQKGMRGSGVRLDGRMPGLRLGTHFTEALVIWKPILETQVWNRPHTEPVALLFADAELRNNG